MTIPPGVGAVSPSVEKTVCLPFNLLWPVPVQVSYDRDRRGVRCRGGGVVDLMAHEPGAPPHVRPLQQRQVWSSAAVDAQPFVCGTKSVGVHSLAAKDNSALPSLGWNPLPSMDHNPRHAVTRRPAAATKGGCNQPIFI
jgi:hypothetical protein